MPWRDIFWMESNHQEKSSPCVPLFTCMATSFHTWITSGGKSVVSSTSKGSRSSKRACALPIIASFCWSTMKNAVNLKIRKFPFPTHSTWTSRVCDFCFDFCNGGAAPPSSCWRTAKTCGYLRHSIRVLFLSIMSCHNRQQPPKQGSQKQRLGAQHFVLEWPFLSHLSVWSLNWYFTATVAPSFVHCTTMLSETRYASLRAAGHIYKLFTDVLSK